MTDTPEEEAIAEAAKLVAGEDPEIIPGTIELPDDVPDGAIDTDTEE